MFSDFRSPKGVKYHALVSVTNVLYNIDNLRLHSTFKFYKLYIHLACSILLNSLYSALTDGCVQRSNGIYKINTLIIRIMMDLGYCVKIWKLLKLNG